MAYVSPILGLLQQQGYRQRRPPVRRAGLPGLPGATYAPTALAAAGAAPGPDMPLAQPPSYGGGAGMGGQNPLSNLGGGVNWGGNVFNNPAALVAWINARRQPGQRVNVEAWLAAHPDAARIFGMGNRGIQGGGVLPQMVRMRRPRARAY